MEYVYLFTEEKEILTLTKNKNVDLCKNHENLFLLIYR